MVLACGCARQPAPATPTSTGAWLEHAPLLRDWGEGRHEWACGTGTDRSFWATGPALILNPQQLYVLRGPRALDERATRNAIKPCYLLPGDFRARIVAAHFVTSAYRAALLRLVVTDANPRLTECITTEWHTVFVHTLLPPGREIVLSGADEPGPFGEGPFILQ